MKGLAKFFLSVVVLASVVIGGYYFIKHEAESAAPGKIAAFDRAYGYKLAMDEVLNQPIGHFSIEHQLVQNLVNEKFDSLLAAYIQKEAEVAKLREERERIRALVPKNPQDTAVAAADFKSTVSKIEQAKSELAFISTTWSENGEIARSCGFEAPYDFSSEQERRKNKGSPKQNSAGSEHRSGFSNNLKPPFKKRF